MASRKHNPGRRKPRVSKPRSGKAEAKPTPAPKKKRVAKKRTTRTTLPAPARRHAQGRRKPRPGAPPGARPGGRPGGISSAAVLKATGHPWDHWLAVLDAFDVRSNGHKAAAEFLSRQYAVGDWWSQMIVVGYEQARGLREKHQKTDGYSVSVSRVIDATQARAFEAWSDDARRSAWLPGASITIRKATPHKSLRITWIAGEGAAKDARPTSVEVNIYAKGDSRCQVSVEHNKLASAADVEKMRAYWTRVVEALKALLEG